MSELTAGESAQYARDGYILRRGLLSGREVDAFRERARSDLESERRAGAVMSKGDGDGKSTLLRMWTSAGDDLYGLLARDERLVALACQLIGKPVYLYSHKMTMKQPREGGAWEWHQDFGYWHDYGCLAPEMMSIYVALDRATPENGCLQVLRGTHRLGRLTHRRENDQTLVDGEYMDAALRRFDLVPVVMEPGDAVAFDCNLLHRSDANHTDTFRWGYIASYNAVDNVPFKRVRDYGNYSELNVVPAGSFLTRVA
jgi:hypothetical protein